MSVESFVRAMPKVELHVHLEGAIQKERLLVIAEHNEIAEQLKHFNQWVALLDKPDFSRLYETIQTTMQWLRHPDDLTHVAYELGVWLARQNVRYAEVSVNPIYFTESGWTFEQVLTALNDGRDRAERGWGVKMRWILTIGRDQPRHADEIVRWASSSTAQNGGVVGIDVGGPEGVQPIGQFERAFRAAAKKNIHHSVHAGEKTRPQDVLETLQQLIPTRLMDGWGSGESPEIRQFLVDNSIPVNLCLKRPVCYGQIDSYAAYPLRRLLDDDVTVILASDLPSYYHTSLNDEYLAAVQHCDLDIEELQQIALNAVNASQLSAEAKVAMIENFQQEYAALAAEHLAGEAQ